MNSREAFQTLRAEMAKRIVGQQAMIERLLVALIADGHLLVEGLPGLAKTRAVKSMASLIEATFSRIQFTPDLLPADITGSELYSQQTGEFRFQHGPIFGNIVLADEINRSPAKVQSALLEAMEERQVTVGGKTYPMGELFLVMATQNPIEQEGTYRLPEAQMDRFLLHVLVDYPTDEEEETILALVRGEADKGSPQRALQPVRMPMQHVLEARRETGQVYVSPAMSQYMCALVGVTRRPQQHSEELSRWLQCGASPRGTLALDRCARACAWLHGRDHVLPEDVLAIVHDALRHRLVLSYEAAAAGVTADKVIDRVLEHVMISA